MIVELQHLSEDNQRRIFEAPVWVSLLASYKHDGEINPEERAEAIHQVETKASRGTRSLRDFYAEVKADFEAKFQKLDATLSTDFDQREAQIENHVREAIGAINLLYDKAFAKQLIRDLDGLFDHVFKSTSNFIQYFAFPVISAELQKSIQEDLTKE